MKEVGSSFQKSKSAQLLPGRFQDYSLDPKKWTIGLVLYRQKRSYRVEARAQMSDRLLRTIWKG